MRRIFVVKGVHIAEVCTGDFKLLSVIPWLINGNPENKFESHCGMLHIEEIYNYTLQQITLE
jgi:hypothetical protein